MQASNEELSTVNDELRAKSEETDKLLDDLNRLCESPENRRRLALWDGPREMIRGEVQWHGVPSYAASSGRPMPVTAECLDKIWQDDLGLRLERFYTDPHYYLEYYLKIRLRKYAEFPDDTPLTRDIPVCFGVTHEAGVLGQRAILDSGDEPTFAREVLFDESCELPRGVDLENNPYLEMMKSFYQEVKRLTGEEFRVIFPQWYRGPQGVALYVRGFENFSLDLYLNPEFVHRLLRFITDATKQYVSWRAEYVDEPILRCDLFNDDIYLMSPESYSEFFLPYEREIADFHGGVYYWHSCGDVTKHVSAVHELPDIGLMDFGVTMEDKRLGMEGLRRQQPLELRVHAQRHIQQATAEEAKAYVRSMLEACRAMGIERYVIRSSGMSVLGGAAEDIRKLGRWVELVREVQAECA